jgi:hypothetical protein
MSGYSGPSQAQPLNDNRQVYLWENESIPSDTYPGSLSRAFYLQRINQSFYPWGASFEVTFSGNPGAFEIDILGANTDAPQNYLQIGMINSVSSYAPGFYVGRWDMPSNVWVKYTAAYMTTLTNAVNVTLQATR